MQLQASLHGPVCSTILGPYSNSPSTLFVASDGDCLRLYQAVIDARSLLMEISNKKDENVSGKLIIHYIFVVYP